MLVHETVVESFKVLRKCVTKYDTEFQKALLIKKLNPKLNSYVLKGPHFCLVFFSDILVCIIIIQFLP